MSALLKQPELLKKYVLDMEYNTHPHFTIDDDIRMSGDDILFTERSSCGYYNESHSIELLDLMCWIYSKINT